MDTRHFGANQSSWGALFLVPLFITGCAPTGTVSESDPTAKENASPNAPLTHTIRWRVENRFSLFDHLDIEGRPPAASHCDELSRIQPGASAAERSAAWLRCYSAEEKGEKIAGYDQLIEVGSPFVQLGNKKTTRPSPWNPTTQNYEKQYLRPRDKHRVSFGIESTNGGTVTGTCQWKINDQEHTGDCAQTNIDGVPSQFSVSVSKNGRIIAKLDEARVERKIVLALGDSYASGEGNPDIPTRWKTDQEIGDNTTPRSLRGYAAQKAEWWDDQCHRSFWSAQMQAALRYAYANPHSYTTFLSFSCSGAEIFDGLILRQPSPPGTQRSPDPETRTVHQSQLSAAADALCVARDKTAVPEVEIANIRAPGEPFSENEAMAIGKTCTDGVRPDKVLLSIGGNDIGFAGVVAWSVLSAKSSSGREKFSIIPLFRKIGTVCPNQETFDHQHTWGKCQNKPARERIDWLDSAYNDLASAMKFQLPPIDPGDIVITNYPNPLRRNTDQKLCDTADFKPNWRDSFTRGRPSPQSAWDGFAYYGAAINLGKLAHVQNWGFNVTPGEARHIEASVIKPLQNTVSSLTISKGWRVASSHLETFERLHGWCSVLPDDAEEPNTFLMPGIERDTIVKAIKRWEWKPYASRGRWIRTVNDSVLTQANENTPEAYNGALHPTAEAHYYVGAAILNAIH